MKTIAIFAVVLLVIASMMMRLMHGMCLTVTSNGANTTLVKVGERLNDREVEEPIHESKAETGTMPELEPEPEMKAAPMERGDPNITVEMNESVNRSGLSMTCTMVKNEHHSTEGTDRRQEINVRHVTLHVAINSTCDHAVETGLKDWWILDERGRKYQTTPHTDIKPTKPVPKLSDGDALDVYVLFDLSGNVADFVVQYNLSNVISSDCEVMSWVVGDPSPPFLPECRDGFVRYPIRATGGRYCTSNRTWINDDLIFYSDGDVKFNGTHRRGLGTWEIAESNRARNAYNATFSGQVYTVNIDLEGSWWSNGCGAGIWNEV